MGTIIQFTDYYYARRVSEGDETRILSTQHKKAILDRYNGYIKIVNEKQFSLLKQQIPEKLGELTGSQEYVLKCKLRTQLLFDILFNSDLVLKAAEKKSIAAALYYFVSEMDFLSDEIPGLGYLDDAFVIREALQRNLPVIKSYLEIHELDEQLYL